MEPEQKGERRFLLKRDAQVPFVMMGYRVPNFTSEDSYALDILDSILSHGKSSRLYQSLVYEQKSSLAVGAEYSLLQTDPGLFYFYALVSPGQKPEVVEEALHREIKRLQADPPTELELQRAKNQVEATHVFEQDSNFRHAMLLGQAESVGAGWRKIDQFVERIRAVTAKDIQRVATPIPDGRQSDRRHADSRASQTTRVALHRRATGKALIMPTTRRLPVAPRRQATLTLVMGLCALLLASGPGVAAEIAPTKFVTTNGITVLVLEQHFLPIVEIHALIKTGSAQDPPDKAGLANLVASLLDEGTTTRTSKQLAEQIDFVGGALEAKASEDFTTASARVLKKDIDLGFTLLADMLQHPAFHKQEFERIRTQLLGEMASDNDDPGHIAMKAFNQLVFHGHPYRWPVNGTEETLNKITLADVQAFYGREYSPFPSHSDHRRRRDA